MGWTGNFSNPLDAGRKSLAEWGTIIAERGHWFLVEIKNEKLPNGFERRAAVVLTDARLYKIVCDVECPYAQGFPVEWLDVLTPNAGTCYQTWLGYQLAGAEERARLEVAKWLDGVRKQGLIPASAAL